MIPGDVAEMQNIEKGSIVECSVVDIVNFGAFVKIKGSCSGLIHISQISEKFVRDINDFISVGDDIIAKVIAIDNRGRIQLSLKGLSEEERNKFLIKKEAPSTTTEHSFEHTDMQIPRNNTEDSFEMKMKKFLRQSDDRQVDIRKNLDSKRGGTKRKK